MGTTALTSVVAGISLALLGAGLAVADDRGAQNNRRNQNGEKQDDRLEQRIKSQMSGFKDVEVDVKDGTATLKGKVGSDTEKARAERMARVEGIVNVDNQIEVDPSKTREEGRGQDQQQPGQPTSPPQQRQNNGSNGENRGAAGGADTAADMAIATRVKGRIMAENALKDSDINVEIDRNGTATLTGTVPSEMAHARALEIARSTKGVRTVKDELKVEAKK